MKTHSVLQIVTFITIDSKHLYVRPGLNLLQGNDVEINARTPPPPFFLLLRYREYPGILN